VLYQLSYVGTISGAIHPLFEGFVEIPSAGAPNRRVGNYLISTQRLMIPPTSRPNMINKTIQSKKSGTDNKPITSSTKKLGAGNGIRTRDPQLGRLTL
jgi:hypothetical protein